MSSLFLAASNDSGINAVPAEFIKYSIILVIAAITTWAAYRRGKMSSGSRDEPVHLAQPVEVKAHIEFAPKIETERRFNDFALELKGVRDEMDAHRRESIREYNVLTKQLNDVLQAGGERENKVLSAMHEMERRLTTTTLHELKDIHTRLNPLAEEVSAMKAVMKSVNRNGRKRA